MNVERLHVVLNEVTDEVSDSAILLVRLRDSLQQAGNEPGQPAHQQTASQARAELNLLLASAPSNGFSPAWLEALDELGVTDLLGERLQGRMEEILSRNEITPSAAASELDPLVQRVEWFTQAVEKAREAFDFFAIGAEELAPGDFEIGFLIPRESVGNELEGLGREFVRLKKILGPFVELGTPGSRAEMPVRSISSSAFGTFLQSTPAVALVVASTVERLIAAYKNVLDIRLAREKLKEAGASERTLQSAADDADSAMGHQIDGIVEGLLEEAPEGDEGRVNELRTELIFALNALSNRIDRGYNIDVRAGALPLPEDDEAVSALTPDEKARRISAEKVRQKQSNLRYVNLDGQPILQLPEGTTDDIVSQGKPPPTDGTNA